MCALQVTAYKPSWIKCSVQMELHILVIGFLVANFCGWISVSKLIKPNWIEPPCQIGQIHILKSIWVDLVPQTIIYIYDPWPANIGQSILQTHVYMTSLRSNMHVCGLKQNCYVIKQKPFLIRLMIITFVFEWSLLWIL